MQKSKQQHSNHIIGANFDNESMWSQNNGKTFKGTGLYMNWQDEDFSLGSEFWYDASQTKLFLDGTLELSTDGEITNANEDFRIDNDGITINVDEPNRFTFEESGTTVSRIRHNTTLERLILETIQGGTANADIELSATRDVRLSPDVNLILENLPTSAPAGSNRVWNDNGTLKIT